jgi:hypothetical protein
VITRNDIPITGFSDSFSFVLDVSFFAPHLELFGGLRPIKQKDLLISSARRCTNGHAHKEQDGQRPSHNIPLKFGHTILAGP